MDQIEYDRLVALGEDYISHFGVKGMHWGVRKDDSSGSRATSPGTASTSNHAKLKKATIIGGSVAGAALLAGGAYYLATHGGLPISSLSSASKTAGKKLVEEAVKPKELTDVIHASKGKGREGFKFLKKGGLIDPLQEFEKGFGQHASPNPGEFLRYGAKAEKLAVAFLDPLGRKDAAGRVIPHEVILPAHHAEGINTYADAVKKAWSLVGHDYNKYFETTGNRL